MTDDSRPHLLRGVKLKNDQVRKSWVLLAPERYLRLNAVSVDILQRCDGAAALSSIVDDLANKYGADRAMIERDVRGLLANLLEKRMLGL
nr:pyrroloquinoline quinone biosynthesis peptide chaperone PqqD [Candidatus Rhodoblastus alkanivorans]